MEIKRHIDDINFLSGITLKNLNAPEYGNTALLTCVDTDNIIKRKSRGFKSPARLQKR